MTIGVAVGVGIGVVVREGVSGGVTVATGVNVGTDVSVLDGDIPNEIVADADPVCDGDDDDVDELEVVGVLVLNGVGCKYATFWGGSTTPRKNPAAAVAMVVNALDPVSYRYNADGVVP